MNKLLPSLCYWCISAQIAMLKLTAYLWTWVGHLQTDNINFTSWKYIVLVLGDLLFLIPEEVIDFHSSRTSCCTRVLQAIWPLFEAQQINSSRGPILTATFNITKLQQDLFFGSSSQRVQSQKSFFYCRYASKQEKPAPHSLTAVFHI